ncbi:MAG: DUF3108 domain-containing protein [Balneolaceae bacterium]|nr:DUF3108 domain-containing protein [Balneolaceae bacterium]MBO6547813.1 DUF3108 domain-containing protein [Balneolaceae bacterium]MBO6648324.1 DUF3108 domain-containing protein [Balneolaceae bacterium]
MKRFLLLSFLLIPGLITAQSPPSAQPDLDDLFSVKETFRYEVKYGFFKLGWVEVSLLPDTMYNGKLHKHLVTKIESNSKIPFMSKEIDEFHSFFYENEDGLPVTAYYWKDNIDENKFKEIEYVFDREHGVVTYKEEDDSRDTLALEEPATAGHIIFYFSRLFAGGDVDNSMPVYVTKKAGAIHFENPSELEKRKYAAFDEPVQAYLTRGTTENIEGPFGFSGEFRAWFRNDDLRVPLEARVKVFLGNAIVKLIEYKREEL